MTSVQLGDARITVRPIASESEARACARIMAGSDPWRTLRKTVGPLLGVATHQP